MQDCVLQLRDVDELMDSIDEFVAGVLEDRKVRAIQRMQMHGCPTATIK